MELFQCEPEPEYASNGVGWDYLRYEMFKRLNSGGSPAEYQEVRNAQVRILGPSGIAFLDFLSKCSKDPHFAATTITISDTSKERGGLQELVLRFFACKDFMKQYKGSVADWLDEYIEAILVSKTITFDYGAQFDSFTKLFAVIRTGLGDGAFVKYRDNKPMGGLAPAYFEAVTMGVRKNLNTFKALDRAEATMRLAKVVQGATFRTVTGPGANSLPKLKKRIDLIAAAISMRKTLDDVVTETIDFRFLEINKLRLHLADVRDRDILGYLASLLIVRTYAFLEAGVKEITNAYLQHHESAIGSVIELKTCYLIWRHSREIRSWVKEGDQNLLLQIDAEIQKLLTPIRQPRLIKIKEEYRTMNSSALMEIYLGCGFDGTLIDRRSAAINQLCGRRHQVAHGHFLTNTTAQDLVDQADHSRGLLSEVLYDLALQCVERGAIYGLKQ